MCEEPVEVERMQAGEDRASGQLLADQCVDDEARGEDEVEQRQRNECRREGGIRRPLDPVLGDEEPDGVATARWDDRVHADAGEIGAEDRAPANEPLRVRRRDDVPPSAADAAELEELAEQRQPERGPADIREVVEEDPDVVDNALHTRPPPLRATAGREARSRPSSRRPEPCTGTGSPSVARTSP